MKLLIVLAAILVCTFADNRACPHREEAVRLLHEQLAVIENADEGIRQDLRIDVDEEIIRDQGVSCISVISSDPDTAPAYLGAGRNREGGISVVMSSKQGRSLEAMLYIYASGEPNVELDEPKNDPEPVKDTKNNVHVTYIKHSS